MLSGVHVVHVVICNVHLELHVYAYKSAAVCMLI